MARNKGMFQFAANFEIKNAAALDPRMVVATKSELYNKNTWPNDGNTVYLYNGLVVAVTEENELYMLIDSVNFSSESSWKRMSVNIDEAVIVEDSLTSSSTKTALSANQGKVLKDMINAIPKYSIEKVDKGYKLVNVAGGNALGDLITFSDIIVKSGSVINTGKEIIIRLVLSNNDTIDIPATALVDVYKPNDVYINITSDNKIGLNFEKLRTDLSIPVDLSEDVAKLTAVIGTSTKGLVKDVKDNTTRIGILESDIVNKVDLSVFSAFQATLLQTVSNLEVLEKTVDDNVTRLGNIENKVDVESVSGAILEAISSFKIKGLIADKNIVITETEDSGIFKIGLSNLTASDVLYEEGVTLKAKIDELSEIKSVGITSGVGITIDTSNVKPIINVKIKEGSTVVADDEGLDIIWREFKK